MASVVTKPVSLPHKKIFMLNKEFQKIIAPHALEMTEYALLNPIRFADDLNEKIHNKAFSRVFQIGKHTGIKVLLNIAPTDDDKDLFWHCSLSYASLETLRSKSILLWTKREHSAAKEILKFLLQTAGAKGTEEFARGKNILNCYKNLSKEEREYLGGNGG